jgi:hypothetical protein
MQEKNKLYKPVKQYNLELPKRFKGKTKELVEYILCCHYKDRIMSAGACAFILNIEKYEFQTNILNKYGIDFSK